MIKFKSFKRSLTALALTAAMVVTALNPIVKTHAAEDTETTSDFDQLNQAEITKDMGAGWNLGNTMEAFTDYGPNEQAWGNPTVTPELFQAVKAAGFKSVRIPISLLEDIGSAPDYKIDADRLKRIKEVIDYAYDAGLYVIVDGVHGDGYHTIRKAWLLITEEDQDTIKEKYAKVWSQYAELFKDYDEHIIFESMNEVFDGNYYDADPTLYKNINAYNQVFVDTIRKSGGNNASRWLLIPGWNTNIDATTMDYGFQIPTDNYRSSSIPADEQRLMISVHFYDPYDFTLNNDSSVTQWGDIATDASKKANWGQEDFMEGQFQKLYKSLVTKGYPVVVGEYCATDKSNKDPENQASRVYFCKKLCENCKKYGAIPEYWDIGAKGAGGSCIIDRKTYEIYSPDLLKGIMDGINADVTPPATFAPSPTMTASGDNADISVKYKCTASAAKSGSIQFNLDITNNDTKPVSLSDVKVRYYYTRDDGKWQSFNCYYAVIGCGNVYSNMVRIPLSSAYDNADFYSEIGFGSGAGVLKPGQSTGQIQITITKYDNSSYNQADDYSFDADADYAENQHITAYVNGNLAFGTEPDGSTPAVTEAPIETTSPTASVEPSESAAPQESIAPSESAAPVESIIPTESTKPVESVVPSETASPEESADITGVVPSVTVNTTTGSSINQSYSVSSLGSKPVELSKLSIRYYFEKSGNKDQSFWCDNAGLQLNKAPYFTDITSTVKGTFHDNYLEITFDTDDVLESGCGTLSMGTRFAQADWSAYENFVDNGYEVYYNGVKVSE